MTNREFYNAVIANEITEDVIAHASEALVKLDERNAKRASKESKTQIANKPIIEAISRVLTDEPMLASKIAELCEISTQKASALVKKVEGVQSVDVKVKGKGTQKGYFLA
jgi:DNA-binding transcriptional regulator GbsR (MarR family)